MGDNVARGLALSSVRVTINQGHVFATEQIRDAYFVTHPQELKEGVYIFCKSQLQRYENGAWNDRAILIFTNSEIVDAENVIVDKDNFTKILKKYAGDNAQSLFDYIDKIEEFPSGSIYIGEKDTNSSWHINQNGQGLQFSRYQSGVYVPIYTIENSATTDNYYINAPEGRLAYITEDKKYHTLIKSSTDLNGCQLGNTEGRISLMNNGTICSYSPIGVPSYIDITKISEEDGKKNATTITEYFEEIIVSDNILMYGVDKFFVESCENDTRVRIFVTDKASGNILGQSCNESIFISNLSQLVVNGENRVCLCEPLGILKGKDVILNVKFTKPIKIQGMIKTTPKSQFYARYISKLQSLKEESFVVDQEELTKVYARKNKEWISIDNIQEPIDDKKYLRSKGKWIEDIGKQNLFDCGYKSDYLKDDFMTYNNKLYKALKDTFKTPNATYQGKSDIVLDSQYTQYTSGDYCQMRIFSPFILKSDNIVTGFRLNAIDTPNTQNCFIALGERELRGGDSYCVVKAVENFDLLSGNNTYVLKNSWNLIKGKTYELIVYYVGKTPNKIGYHNGFYVEDSVIKVGYVDAITGYGVAFDSIKNDFIMEPKIDDYYRFHQGVNSYQTACLTPIIEVATISDWVEVVGGSGGISEISWEDIKDKPIDILTETLLTTEEHIGIPIKASGKGIYAKSSTDINDNCNVIKYDKDYDCIEIGDIKHSTKLVSSDLNSSQFIKSNRIIVQSDAKDLLPNLKYESNIIIAENSSKIDSITINVKNECVISAYMFSATIVKDFKCNVGNNKIQVDSPALFKRGNRIPISIETNTPSLGGTLTPIPNFYLEYNYSIIKNGEVLTSEKPILNMVISENGRIITKNSQEVPTNLLALERRGLEIGNHDIQTTIKSARPIMTSIICEEKDINLTEMNEELQQQGFTHSVELPKGEKYQFKFLRFSLRKDATVNIVVNGKLVSSRETWREKGQVNILLEKPFLVSDKMDFTIMSNSNDCFFGDNVNFIPNIAVVLLKTKESELVDAEFTRNIKIQEDDNMYIHGFAGSHGINEYNEENIAFESSGNYPIFNINPLTNERSFLFNGDFNIQKDGFLRMRLNDLNIGSVKTRIEFYFDTYVLNGYKPELVFNEKTLQITSDSGHQLNVVYNINKCSETNIEYHAYADYYDGDTFTLHFGEGTNLSNTKMWIRVNESDEGRTLYLNNLFNDRGYIRNSLISNEIATTEYVKSKTQNIIDVDKENMTIITRKEASDFKEYQCVSMLNAKYQVGDVEKLDSPITDFYESRYSTRYGAKSNIANSYIQTRIEGYGGTEGLDWGKPISIVYKICGDTICPTINLNTVNIMDNTGKVLIQTKSIESVGNVVTIKFMASNVTPNFYIGFGDGNNLSNSFAYMTVASKLIEQTETNLFGKDNKIKDVFYDKSEFDYKIDLTKNQNLEIIRQPQSVTYEHIHDIPFKREEDWTPNEYTKFSDRTPEEDISMATHVVIKGIEPFVTNYTDLSVRYKIEVKHEDGTISSSDCKASTGQPSEYYVYSSLSKPILKNDKITLFVNPLNDPYGFVPNDKYNIEFYKLNGSLESIKLFDKTSGKINKDMLPNIVGDIYLSDTMRISNKNNSFSFQRYIGENWVEVGNIS